MLPAARGAEMSNRMFLLILLINFISPHLSFGKIPSSIFFMSYNVQNLFDTTHDRGKLDYPFLPKALKDQNPEVQAYCKSVPPGPRQNECFELDWNPKVLARKIHNIASVIRSANNGRGPDVLVLAEVENINVVRMLINGELKDLGYETIILYEGPDKRGIDTAIISRLPTGKPPRYHQIDLTGIGRSPTRGILEATFKAGNNLFVVFANHWPSQEAPAPFRMRAAETLKKAVSSIPPNIPLIAMGDFNTKETDQLNGIRQILTTSKFPNYFYDSGIQKCIQESQRQPNGGRNSIGGANVCPPGTHYYGGEKSWSYFDRILVSDAWVKKYGTEFRNFQVYSPAFITDPNAPVPVPLKFNTQTGQGFSDHFPVTLQLPIHD